MMTVIFYGLLLLLLIDESLGAFIPNTIKANAILSNKHKNKNKPLFFSATSSSDSTIDDLDTNIDDTNLFKVNIALTRELNKNDKLMEKITNHPTTKMLKNAMKIKCVELPCIEHATGPDLESFEQFLMNSGDNNENGLSKFDYIVITSPESAKVFHEALQKSGNSNIMDGIQIAAVGKATKKVLKDLEIDVDFIPSKANGQTLGEELPPVDKVKLNRVLYPASAKAESTIQDVLEERKDASFSVTRFNTYDTVPVTLPDEQVEMIMDDIQIACFGSPSSVDAYLKNVDRILGIEDKSDEDKKKTPGSNGNSVAVCIGSTSARRCLESGRWQAMDIYYPKSSPGLEGWADSCLQAAGDIMENSFWS